MKKRLYEVKDCFKDQCPKLWEHLEATDKTSIKFCNECQENVYKATSKAKLLEYGAEGKCVAYFHYEEEPLLGYVQAPSYNISDYIPKKPK